MLVMKGFGAVEEVEEGGAALPGADDEVPEEMAREADTHCCDEGES